MVKKCLLSCEKSTNLFFFPGTCACTSGNLKIQSHADFIDGALLEHPAIQGDYTFVNDLQALHPRGYFTKAAGKSLNVFVF